jgi:hypothetical protein
MNRIRIVLLRLLQLLILLDFALIPAWWKWSSAPAPFTADYVTGFVLWTALFVTVILWLLTGCYGWRNLFRTWKHTAWTMSLLSFLCWSGLSISWAYGARDYGGLAPNFTLQLATISAFSLVVISAAPSTQTILSVLAISAGVHGVIGFLQVMEQQSIGLKFFGELTLDPARSGVSIIQSGDLRWLRPYGLLPHPNIYAGIIAVGIFGAFSWMRVQKNHLRIVLLPFLLWVLLLTFSRGAWIAFAGASVPVLIHYGRDRTQRRKLMLLAIVAISIGMIFIISYAGLLLARTGVVEEGVEMRSISDRIVYNRIAWDAIQYAPIQGVGAGNFPWYASNYLFYRTDFDLRGDHVHNIYLSIFSEFGLIGILLFAIWIGTGFAAAASTINQEKILLLACMIFFLVVGLVDHYPWTLLHTQTLFIGLFAAAIHPTNSQGAAPESAVPVEP